MKTPGWELRLHRLFAARRRTPFAWGSFDCCIFALDAYEACTELRPQFEPYDSALSAERVLASVGGMVALATSTIGSEPIPVKFAQRGDIVLATNAAVWGTALAVCAGHVIYAPNTKGLAIIPKSMCTMAWRV